MGPNNQYEAALNSVGYVVEPYDADRSFPVFGFGGVWQGATNHCFALNGNPAAPEIQGIANIVATYKQTLPSIQLSGPTYFAPLLQQFLAYCRAMVNTPTYNVMLILTDGAIHDMPATKNLIVDLSELPCSVIIIGVGNADFSMMEELDGDGKLLRGTNGASKRDIVQFVRFNEALARGDLAEQVLKEIPEQLCSHMERTAYKPQAVAQDLSHFEAGPSAPAV